MGERMTNSHNADNALAGRFSAKAGYPAPISAQTLIAGPCALPNAPLSMPMQTLEPEFGVMQRLKAWLRPLPAGAIKSPIDSGI